MRMCAIPLSILIFFSLIASGDFGNHEKIHEDETFVYNEVVCRGDKAIIVGDFGEIAFYDIKTQKFSNISVEDNITFNDAAPLSDKWIVVGEQLQLHPFPIYKGVMYEVNESNATSLNLGDDYRSLYGASLCPSYNYVIVVGNGGIVLKYDGENLIEIYNNDSYEFRDVAWDDSGNAVICGYDFDLQRACLIKYDENNFTVVSNSSYPNLYFTSIDWYQPLSAFIILGEQEEIYLWNNSGLLLLNDSLKNIALNDVDCSNKYALIVGYNIMDFDNNSIMLIYNGNDFLTIDEKSYSQLNGCDWYGKEALIVGDGGTVIRYSLPNAPPECIITFPPDDLQVYGLVMIMGKSSDLDGNETILYTEVKIDNSSWETANGTVDWNYLWNTSLYPNGEHTIYARAYDGQDYSQIASVKVYVKNPNTPPECKIVFPKENMNLSGTVLITGYANDSDVGDVVEKVYVKIDDEDWEEALGTYSWSYEWDTTKYDDGTHIISAIAWDGEDNSTVTTISVGVQNNPPNHPPTCRILYPEDDAILCGEITVTGTAADADGDALSVYIRVDDNEWYSAELNRSTWQYTINTSDYTGGMHTIYAMVSDGKDNTTDYVKVLFNNPPVCIITSPKNGDKVFGNVTIKGSAMDPDDDDIRAVYIRIDAGTWKKADGTRFWSYTWVTDVYSEGEYTIYAKATDGKSESSISSIRVKLVKPPSPVTLHDVLPNDCGDTWIKIRWSMSNADDFKAYQVHMSEEYITKADESNMLVYLPNKGITDYKIDNLEPGMTYYFVVKVVDEDGFYADSNVISGTTKSKNKPPVASIKCLKSSIWVYDEVKFSAEDSYDPDGTIVEYLWDFEGKGEYPISSGQTPTQEHIFTKSGKYTVSVKVIDDRGAWSTEEIIVTVKEREEKGIDMDIVAVSILLFIIIIVAGYAVATYIEVRSKERVRKEYGEEE